MRPSALLGLEAGSYEAFCLDEVVYIWGSWVMGELHKVQAKTEAATQRNQQMRLMTLLGTKGQKGMFADPALEFGVAKGGE